MNVKGLSSYARQRHAAARIADAENATTWYRWTWIYLTTEWQAQLARVERNQAWLARQAQSLEARVQTPRRRDGRPYSPATLRNYAAKARYYRRALHERRQDIEGLHRHAPGPYYTWRREREAWLRRQLTTLRVGP